MSKVHAVLLIPEDGDPHNLLKEGPCGARPPMASPYEGKFEAHTSDWAPCWPGETALVLAWDGEPVAEGLDRLSRAIRGHGWLMQMEDSAPAKVATWALSVARGTGTLVLLDADGREVSDE